MKWNEFTDWQKHKLIVGICSIVIIATVYLFITVSMLYNDKKNEDEYWTSNLTMSEETQKMADERSVDATKVLIGTYIENIKEINIKSSYFRNVYQIWFRWEGNPDLNMKDNFHVYKGNVNSKEIIKEYHEGNTNYQLIRADITVTKNYWTRRFPLESHQLRVYLESDYPIEDVVFVPDNENSEYNSNLGIAGYDIRRHATAVYAVEYDNAHSDPDIKEKDVMTSEFVTALEINRDGAGLYFKCFVALIGTVSWVMIALFICTYHHVDPLGMMPAALFGTVTNIMVGANLLPDALQIGLLEFTNIWGIMTILSCAIAVININRIRTKYQDKKFATYLGRIIFGLLLFFIIVGNILLPLSAFLR